MTFTIGRQQDGGMKRLYRWGMVAIAPALAACLSIEGPPGIGVLAEGGHHVLFIGNSLTYTNNLSGTVAALARSVGDTIRVGEVLPLSAGPDALRRAGSGGLDGRLVLSTGV